MKLRNEIGQLHLTLRQMDRLRHDVERLNARLNDATGAEATGRDDYRALLQDEMPRRLARVARLKQWLDENPQEKIPGLESVSEADWIARVDDPLVMDEDFQAAASRVRARADAQFAGRASQALKQYGQANIGQFPADLSQLEPYFDPPVDAAVLQRFEIVPATSLCSYLAELGGDWLITEKAPINKQQDQRCAVGTNGYRSTIYFKRWDPVP